MFCMVLVSPSPNLIPVPLQYDAMWRWSLSNSSVSIRHAAVYSRELSAASLDIHFTYTLSFLCAMLFSLLPSPPISFPSFLQPSVIPCSVLLHCPISQYCFSPCVVVPCDVLMCILPALTKVLAPVTLNRLLPSDNQQQYFNKCYRAMLLCFQVLQILCQTVFAEMHTSRLQLNWSQCHMDTVDSRHLILQDEAEIKCCCLNRIT